MKKQSLIVAAIVGSLSGASFLACSSSNGTGTTGTGNSTGTGNHTTTNSSTGTTMTSSSTGGAPTTSSSSTGGMTTTTGTGGTGNCSKVTTLHPPKLDAGPGTIFCPFSGIDGGKDEYCTAQTEHCCETPAGTTPSACVPIATACMTGTGYTDWQCEDPVADCPASAPVCCAPGASIGLGMPAGQCGNFAHMMTHTTCVAAGDCMGIIMCTSDAECPTGQTCTPFGKAGNQVGGCM